MLSEARLLSSMLTQRKRTGLPAYSSFNSSTATSSHVQGVHHVAPKETTHTSPFVAAVSYVLPSSAFSLKPTSLGSAGGAGVCCCAAAQKEGGQMGKKDKGG